MPDRPARLRAPAPSPTESIRERRAAHTDEERDRARARLRVAQHTFTRIEPDYWAAINERYAAVAAGWDVGLTVREICALLGGLPTGHVQRMRARVEGEDTYAGLRLARARARRDRQDRPPESQHPTERRTTP